MEVLNTSAQFTYTLNFEVVETGANASVSTTLLLFVPIMWAEGTIIVTISANILTHQQIS